MKSGNQRQADIKSREYDAAAEADIGPRLEKLRRINNLCATGQITGQEQLALHRALVRDGEWGHLKNRGVPEDRPHIWIIRVADLPRY